MITLRLSPPNLTIARRGRSVVASNTCWGIFMNFITVASTHHQYIISTG